ncbi:MAG: glycerate kinase [Actinomycetota bacterium]
MRLRRHPRRGALCGGPGRQRQHQRGREQSDEGASGHRGDLTTRTGALLPQIANRPRCRRRPPAPGGSGAAHAAGVPCVVLGGRVDDDADALYAAGANAVLGIGRGVKPMRTALRASAGDLRSAARAVCTLRDAYANFT